jgi:hypothetical protein
LSIAAQGLSTAALKSARADFDAAEPSAPPGR